MSANQIWAEKLAFVRASLGQQGVDFVEHVL
jgi:hypothetical protein